MSKNADKMYEQVWAKFKVAQKEVGRLAQELNQASDREAELSEALNCKHTELEDASTDGIMQTRCKKCKFVWAD